MYKLTLHANQYDNNTGHLHSNCYTVPVNTGDIFIYVNGRLLLSLKFYRWHTNKSVKQVDDSRRKKDRTYKVYLNVNFSND